VTFDTQTLDPITLPRRVACKAINESLKSGRLQGFICETMLTVEGQPPREETLIRVRRALDLGCRILSAPRRGSRRLDDPSGELYAQDADESALATRLHRFESIAAAIEARGLGFARMSKAPAAGRKAARAVAEWADGDSVAAHHGYANDLFCTEDRAARAGRKSVLHPAYRGWLRRAYGVEFVTMAELAVRLEGLD
jgi:hypothetical protein